MNGDLFLIYTLEEGGMFQIRRTTHDEYTSLVETGEVDVTPPDLDRYGPGFAGARIVQPKFAALLRVEENFDFISGAERVAAAPTVA